MSTYAIVMAGGAGTRFWPASRSRTPKQLLPLGADPNESLLAATLRRIEPLVPAERVYIATGAHLAAATAAIAPGAKILAEPVPRNTAPCIGWASAVIESIDPHATVMVLPSDHFIADEPAFLNVLVRAVESAQRGIITTIGVVPSRPETGYGYIEIGDEIAPGVRRARRFVEKPDLARAQEYLASGLFLWNAGMFFFKASVMREAIATHLPDLARGLSGDVMASFPSLPSISIDHGVMEKLDQLAVVPGDFGWNDVGSWQSAWELAEKDASGNALPQGAVAVASKNNLVRAPAGKVYALVGVSDLVVVETEGAVLVMSREKAQDVREVVEALKARGRTDLL